MECMMHLKMIFFERFFSFLFAFPQNPGLGSTEHSTPYCVNKLTNRTGKEAACLGDGGVLLPYDTCEIHGELISSQITAFEYQKNISMCQACLSV